MVLILVLSLLTVELRIWRLDVVPTFRDSEIYLVPAAYNYDVTGQETPDNWYLTPLRHIIMQWSIAVFGNNPYGWRMRNAIFGVMGVLLIYLIAKRIFEDRKTAFLAALLLSLDALYLRYSRASHGEIMAVVFILSALYCVLRYSGRSMLPLLGAGVFLGLANAVKWYFLPAQLILLILIISRIYRMKKPSLQPILAAVLAFTILPFSIYALTFYNWFGRGFGLSDFIAFHSDAYRVMQGLTLEAVPGFYPEMIKHSGNFSGWFLRPVIFGYQNWSDGKTGVYDIVMNNFPLVLLVLPAVLFLLYKSIRTRSESKLLVAVLFLSTYLQFLLAKRPIWIYSAIPLLPFGYLAVAFLAASILEKIKHSSRLFLFLTAVIILYGLYLFPFINSFPVSEALYAPLRAIGHIEKGS